MKAIAKGTIQFNIVSQEIKRLGTPEQVKTAMQEIIADALDIEEGDSLEFTSFELTEVSEDA
jgi:hypothetical protein